MLLGKKISHRKGFFPVIRNSLQTPITSFPLEKNVLFLFYPNVVGEENKPPERILSGNKKKENSYRM
jgi:hypothetical protein